MGLKFLVYDPLLHDASCCFIELVSLIGLRFNFEIMVRDRWKTRIRACDTIHIQREITGVDGDVVRNPPYEAKLVRIGM